MSITDELREFMDRADGYELWCPRHKTELTAIDDRIDAEHQKAEDELKAKDGQSWLHGYAECREELMEGHPVIAASLEEAGWVKLPVSEDGDVLHIGELVDERLPFGGYAAPAPIDTMELSRGASGYVWMVKLDAESRALINPKLLRHHHAPTVEDVLREFVERLDEIGSEDDCVGVDEQECRACIRRDIAAAYAEYAAKLRLAEDNDGLYEWERDE